MPVAIRLKAVCPIQSGQRPTEVELSLLKCISMGEPLITYIKWKNQSYALLAGHFVLWATIMTKRKWKLVEAIQATSNIRFLHSDIGILKKLKWCKLRGCKDLQRQERRKGGIRCRVRGRQYQMPVSVEPSQGHRAGRGQAEAEPKPSKASKT